MASAISNAAVKGAATLASKPVEYAWKGTKGIVKGLASYTWGAIAETFRGVRRGFGKINQGFTDSFPHLKNAMTKSKEAIMSVFGCKTAKNGLVNHQKSLIAHWSIPFCASILGGCF